MPWTVNTNIDLDNGNIFYIQLASDTDENFFISHYFNITGAKTSTSPAAPLTKVAQVCEP